MAAVLACGPGALLSHRSAAALWGVVRPPGSSPDVLVTGCRARRRGLRIHITRCLDRKDRATHDGIPLTSLPRTLIDLAAVLDRAGLERAIEESDRLGLFDLREVEDLLGRGPRRPGSKALRLALSIYREPAVTRSELERRFLEVLRASSVPAPSVNAYVAGYEIDALWRRERFAVELDGFEFHRTRAAFERDRRRDEELRLAGYDVVRLTWRRLESEPQTVGRRIRAHLARRRR